MTVCAHCPVVVLAVSIGYIHADTHNTHSDMNGSHAATPGLSA